jgi:hypothetical protein
MNAYDGAGFASLQGGDAAGALPLFERALDLYPEHARSLVGLGAASLANGEPHAAERAFERASAAMTALRRGGRGSEATLAEAFLHTVHGRLGEAVGALHALVEQPDMPFTGWTIPVEPLLAPLRQVPAYQPIALRLAENAR